MSLFSVLSTGTRGLSASQLAMNIVGQNISNADVEGYSRKRLNLSADYRYDPVHGQIGTGVEVINIERYRNEYIDQQIRKQNQMLGMYEEQTTRFSRLKTSLWSHQKPVFFILLTSFSTVGKIWRTILQIHLHVPW